MRRLGFRMATAVTVVALASVVAAGQPGCMLITSPGNFSIVDGGPDAPAMRADGGGDGSGACSSLVGSSACGTCIASNCCGSYTACDNETACTALLGCAENDTSCMMDNAGGEKAASAYGECVTKHCSVCSEAGVGDPCGADGMSCAKGLLCSGVSCTKSCGKDSDCKGLYMEGENSSGGQNRCAEDADDQGYCFPGCAGNSDCTSFADTTCIAASPPGGGTTNVCGTSAPDAGEETGPADGSPTDGASSDGGRDATVKDARSE
jgi:hypothetical protein